VGKTALARRCLAQAAGLQVLSARGDQAEADLDFGIVDQLLRAAGGVSQLVVPAEGAGSVASSFAVGARLLELAGEQAAAGPVAIVVDDLQWADRKSVEALTFMLRRLSVDPVIAIMIYRRPGDRLDEAAQRMLRSVEDRLLVPLEGLPVSVRVSHQTQVPPFESLPAEPGIHQSASRRRRGIADVRMSARA